jgi:hypothetical protein
MLHPQAPSQAPPAWKARILSEAKAAIDTLRAEGCAPGGRTALIEISGGWEVQLERRSAENGNTRYDTMILRAGSDEYVDSPDALGRKLDNDRAQKMRKRKRRKRRKRRDAPTTGAGAASSSAVGGAASGQGPSVEAAAAAAGSEQEAGDAAVAASYIARASMDADDDQEGAQRNAQLDAFGLKRRIGKICRESNSLRKMRKVNNVDESWSSMLFEEATADVELQLDSGVVIPAHRSILSARSPVFAAMLSSGMREGAERRVKLSAVDELTMRALLEIMYTGACHHFGLHVCQCGAPGNLAGDVGSECQCDVTRVIGVAAAADFYAISDAQSTIMDELLSELSPVQKVSVLQRLESGPDVELGAVSAAVQARCVQTIARNYGERGALFPDELLANLPPRSLLRVMRVMSCERSADEDEMAAQVLEHQLHKAATDAVFRMEVRNEMAQKIRHLNPAVSQGEAHDIVRSAMYYAADKAYGYWHGLLAW